MENEYAMVISTCSDRASAKVIAQLLVEQRLAACVQMLPAESVYRWQGEICEDSEIVLFIKTRAVLFDKVAAKIRELHTYEVPEIIQVPIADGLPDYLNWIGDCTKAEAAYAD